MGGSYTGTFHDGAPDRQDCARICAECDYKGPALSPAETVKRIDSRAPLVGRSEELAVLEEALDAVLEKGETRIVSVIGPAGVGKTRLVQELIGRHKIGPKAIRV